MDLDIVIAEVFGECGWTSRRLGGGMTNLNWRVDVAGEAAPYFVQLMMPEHQAREIGIDRALQRRVLAVAHHLGMAPPTRALLEQPPAIVTEFVLGQPLPEVGPDRRRGLGDIAVTLATLHAQPVDESFSGVVSDTFVGGRWLVPRALASAPGFAEEITWVSETLDVLEHLRGTYQPVLVHSDLSPNNILVGDQRTTLIDWEYAGLGDRWADLGDLATKCALTADEERAVLDAYAPGWGDTQLAYVRLHRYTGMAREALWALATATVEFSDFDHLEYAEQCLGTLRAFAEGESFSWATDVLTTSAQRAAS